MKRRCPNLSCSQEKPTSSSAPKSTPIVRKGAFYRRSDRRRITRYFCKQCKTHFSSATHHPDFRQKRREINEKIKLLQCSGVSQRRLALILNANRKTVVKKFRLLAERARVEHATWLSQFHDDKITQVQFDDLETSEHTKCKPLSVTLAVREDTREILAFQVSRMPAKGHLSRVSVQKYGYRRDERPENWKIFFKSLIPILSQTTHFKSDENPHYPKALKTYFPSAVHETFPGARGAVAGQGELKKLRFDPLFSLNHTCAMLRANLNRLFRRTWCTTKTVQGLIDHLSLYVVFHNQALIGAGAAKGAS